VVVVLVVVLVARKGWAGISIPHKSNASNRVTNYGAGRGKKQIQAQEKGPIAVKWHRDTESSSIGTCKWGQGTFATEAAMA